MAPGILAGIVKEEHRIYSEAIRIVLACAYPDQRATGGFWFAAKPLRANSHRKH